MPSVLFPVAPTAPALLEQLPADWSAALADEIAKPAFAQLDAFVSDERRRHTVFPPALEVFAALKRTPLSRVNVVLLGQDPYPTRGNANGLSFSVARGQKVPPSL